MGTSHVSMSAAWNKGSSTTKPRRLDEKCSRQEQHHGVSGKMMFETKRLEYILERRRARQALQGTLEPYGVED